MLMQARRLRAAFAALLLGAAALATPCLAADVESPQGLLKGQVPDNVAALKRVVIASFIVQYVTDFGIESKGSRSSRGAGDVFYSKWKDPPAELLQSTTDALHAKLVAELQAAGIEVVPAEQVAAQASMAELRKVGRANPAVVSDSTIRKASTLVSAQGLPLLLTPVPDVKLASYATQPIEGTDAPRNLMNWDAQASQWLLASNGELSNVLTIFVSQLKLAEGLNATLLNVRMTLPLVDMGITSKLGGLLGGGALFAEASTIGHIKSNPRFVEAGTVFGFAQAGANPGHRHMLALNKPVPITGLKVTPDKDKKSVNAGLFSGSDEKTARSGGLLGALSGALGGAAGVSNDSADFWVSVDTADFQSALVSAGSTIFKDLALLLSTPR
jgi:hypothetical protein